MTIINMLEQATDPDTPSAGRHKLYPKTEGFHERLPDGSVRSISRPDATQAEAEAGTEVETRNFSPLRIKQAVDALQAGASPQTIFVPVTISGSKGDFGTMPVATNGSMRISFLVPNQAVTITAIELVGIIEVAAAGIDKDIDLDSDYGKIGELFNQHSESDTTTLYDLSSSTDELSTFDLMPVLTNVEAQDFVGIFIKHNAIGGSINYLGVRISYDLV